MLPSFQHLKEMGLAAAFSLGFSGTLQGGQGASPLQTVTLTCFHKATCSVPQGGVLSPIFFNIALVGLADQLLCAVEASLYADDICI